MEIVFVQFPHLCLYKGMLDFFVSEEVDTIGIFPSGKMILNEKWFSSLSVEDAKFIVMHEIMHLAFLTHKRCKEESDKELVNFAHDLVINYMLCEEFNFDYPPASGVYIGDVFEDYKKLDISLENIFLLLKERQIDPKKNINHGSTLFHALKSNYPNAKTKSYSMDVLDDNSERQMINSPFDPEKIRQIEDLSIRSVYFKELIDTSHDGLDLSFKPVSLFYKAIKANYHPPWEAAIQQWIEGIGITRRTYARPNRKGSSSEYCLPGKETQNYTINILLDVSGSMFAEQQKILGAIAVFCDNLMIPEVRILQCDTTITKDEIVTTEELENYEINGLGGSDLSPGMFFLASDPNVENLIVITDGYINYPPNPMPYSVLWTLVGNTSFHPPYGAIVSMYNR